MFDRQWVSKFGALIAIALVLPLTASTRFISIDPDFIQLGASLEAQSPGKTLKPVKSEGSTKPAKPEQTAAPIDKRILLDEDFDSGTLDPKIWNTCHWWADRGCTISSNDELEWYLPKQVRISDGALNLTADRRTVRGSDSEVYEFASGMVTTGPPTYKGAAKLAFTYGKVEARVWLPSGQGLWPAIWLLPASTESRPEIDILEMLGNDPERLRMRLHPKDRQAESIGGHYIVPGGYSLMDSWHTVGMDWTPGKLVYLLDGKKVLELAGNEVPDEPMYLVMNLAVGGNYPGPPNKETVFPAVMKIDHVRILKND